MEVLLAYIVETMYPARKLSYGSLKYCKVLTNECNAVPTVLGEVLELLMECLGSLNCAASAIENAAYVR